MFTQVIDIIYSFLLIIIHVAVAIKKPGNEEIKAASSLISGKISAKNLFDE